MACEKELAEGVDAVRNKSGNEEGSVVIVNVPLLKDGCVDTEVDELAALEAIAPGDGVFIDPVRRSFAAESEATSLRNRSHG